MLYVNDTFPKIVGYPAKELIGQKPPYPYWAKNYVAELTERLLSATNHPEAEETLPVVTRFEAVRKNGEEFWAELRISPLLDDDGKPFGSIGALFDVTNSVLAQSRVEAANERFTLVVESMASAIAVLAEPNRDVLFFANRSYRTLFNDRPNGAAKLLARLEKAPPTVQSDGIFDEETSRWFDVRSQRIVWTRGETAVMVIATDITKRRELDLAEKRSCAAQSPLTDWLRWVKWRVHSRMNSISRLQPSQTTPMPQRRCLPTGRFPKNAKPRATPALKIKRSAPAASFSAFAASRRKPTPNSNPSPWKRLFRKRSNSPTFRRVSLTVESNSS